MFDAFAARNAGRNAEVVNEIVGKSARRASFEGENAAQVKKLQKKDPLKLKEKDLVDTLYNKCWSNERI